MQKQLTGLIVAFAALFVLFWILQSLWPSVRGQRVLRSGFLTDCIYWLWTPIATRGLTAIAIGLVLFPLAAYYGMGLKDFLHGHGALARQPLWLQAMEIFVAGDFLGYWQHRIFHGRNLWRFHAIHHSSTELDWLSSVRLHPVNDTVARLIAALPLVVAGFDTGVVAIYAPFITFCAIMVHANLNWDYGPFRYVVASPTFHRWHHTSAEEGLDKNFSGGLPIWDLLFGTFYMPRDKQPEDFGISDAVPRGFVGQLLTPFRAAAPQSISRFTEETG